MKKIIFKSLLLLSAIFFVGCSEENETEFNTPNTSNDNLNQLAGRSSAWDGEIGVYTNGAFVVTADKAALIADLEDVLKREGHETTLKTLEIVEKVATNDPNDVGYMLVGADDITTSIAVWLKRTPTNLVKQNSLEQAAGSTTCTGCASGCNLAYLTVNGKKVAYCNENGCVYDCTKSESAW